MTGAVILAAGFGTRLAPLTDHTPKPLIKIGETSLIERLIAHLASGGYRELVINLAWLGDQIETRLGDGTNYGVEILYSREPDGALETGGGIAHALPLLGNQPFAVINADIATDYPFEQLRLVSTFPHLVLVPNPDHNPNGDFSIDDGKLSRTPPFPFTFAGIAAYHPAWFADRRGRFALAPMLYEAAAQGHLSGEVFKGSWADIGTPERLRLARQAFTGAP